ncbi:hypothetical protein [Alteromonas macleodii]|uniref:hypothetical protein n=1 Tax=Alteromonas macleodii TaxID=28108 RepID=UPI0024A7FFAF|nr:hypothetical protein [Alteromonas macleodii]|tara:strand:+ start:438 stop:677 length:240 start_codon:yes stop_codon:yes gene_type:complete
MAQKPKSIIKVTLFAFTSLMMWALLYTGFNTNDGEFTHSVLSGVLLVVPVLILNFIGSRIFMQTMQQQNREAIANEQGK